MQQSQAITRKSASNLALAFVLLPKPKRDAMSALYAFCREVDDVADEESVAGRTPPRRVGGLARGHPPRLRRRRAGISRQPGVAARHSGNSGCRFELFDELIKGCEMDLDTKRYETHAATGTVLLSGRVGGRPVEH